jgi:hypothetical protein
MKSKKGMEMSISTIVVLVIAVVVLVAVVSYFLSGFAETGSTVRDVSKSADVDSGWEDKMSDALDVFSDKCVENGDCDTGEECKEERCEEIE